jgi:hypothetical protein
MTAHTIGIGKVAPLGVSNQIKDFSNFVRVGRLPKRSAVEEPFLSAVGKLVFEIAAFWHVRMRCHRETVFNSL